VGRGLSPSAAGVIMTGVHYDYEIVIQPSRGWLRLNLTDVWRYRDLLFLLVHRDFIAKYKQTVLGPAWFVIQPLLMTVVFTVVFGKVVKIPTDGLPPMLFYLAGLLGWSYFSQSFQSISDTLISNANLFGKVYFPRMVVPLAAVISNLLALALQLATFLCFWVYFKFFTASGWSFGFTLAVAWLPLLIVQIAVASLGVGLWLSALTVKYRDFRHLSAFLVQLWMYATPVIYPLSQVPEKWRWLVVLNPMTVPIETIRYMLLGQGVIESAYLAIALAITIFFLLTGALVFDKVEKTFVDFV
jgi:lipopolysaccharide transport system permease protein